MMMEITVESTGAGNKSIENSLLYMLPVKAVRA